MLKIYSNGHVITYTGELAEHINKAIDEASVRDAEWAFYQSENGKTYTISLKNIAAIEFENYQN